MNTTQKRCMVTSAALHTSLLLIIALTPALATHHDVEEGPEIVMLPTNFTVTDNVTSGAGEPTVQSRRAPTPPPAVPVAPPVDTPPADKLKDVRPPKDTPPERERTTERPKPAPKSNLAEEPKHHSAPVEDPDGVKRPQNKKNQRDKKSDDDTTPKSGKKPNISDEIKTHRSADDAEAKKAAADKAAEEADRQARDDARRAQRDAAANRAKSMAAIQQALNGASGSMAGKFSSDTEITMPGPGRAAFVKYFEYLHALYLQSWKQPAAISKSEAYVMAEIIVLRDGTLKDFRITKPSGIREFDESVREVLRSHRKLMPLPSDSTDPERAFSIRFTIDSNANSST